MIDSANEIKKQWRIISTGASSIIELRALWPNGIGTSKRAITKHFSAKDYADGDSFRAAFEKETLRLNSEGYNCYIVMNPIRHDFQGNVGSAATDKDIIYRDLVLVDVDRATTAKEPANDLELDEAKKLAEAVEEHLRSKGFSDPLRTMSGNGHHLYYVLDKLPNDDATTKAIEQFLKGLATKFNNSTVKIDTGVYNASRITKVLGTVARKGIAKHPEIGAIVLECTDLPPYAAKIREAVNLPVFDFNSYKVV